MSLKSEKKRSFCCSPTATLEFTAHETRRKALSPAGIKSIASHTMVQLHAGGPLIILAEKQHNRLQSVIRIFGNAMRRGKNEPRITAPFFSNPENDLDSQSHLFKNAHSSFPASPTSPASLPSSRPQRASFHHPRCPFLSQQQRCSIRRTDSMTATACPW